jgi:hypothetical protein
MITKEQFESKCTNSDLSDIIDINSRTTGESALYPINTNEGGGLDSTEKDEVIEYLDGTDFDTAHSSNSEMGWANAGKKEPC